MFYIVGNFLTQLFTLNTEKREKVVIHIKF